MRQADQCGARDHRTGLACARPAEPDRRRCRRHGGVRGIGAPSGNKYRLVDGFYSAAAKSERRAARELLRQGWGLLREWE